MSDRLRETYSKISVDYQSKKRDIWQDFAEFKSEIKWTGQGVVIDLGAGNGRNLREMQGSLLVALDLSHQLLLGYIGPTKGQKIAGALPNTPFRRGGADCILSLAVLHHFQKQKEVIESLLEMRRISEKTNLLISVWRRWRKNYAHKLIRAFKAGEKLDPLINHHRPWYNSSGEKLGTRFYHYYTFKELYYQVQESGLRIQMSQYWGGKYNDANIFAVLVDAVD